jgi:type IV fimbrial biogenesis protein FimT
MRHKNLKNLKKISARTLARHRSVGGQGFTLIELMVVIALVAILSAIVIPGLSSFVQDGRVSANVNEFISSITFARTEAVKRGRLVTMCRSSNADAGNASTCLAAGDDWASGWIVYEESTTADVASVGTRETSEPIAIRRGALLSNIIVKSNPAISRITFNSLGQPVGPAAAATLGFDFSVKEKSPRKVCISRIGRVKVIQRPAANAVC